jgi:hypothetical protein
MEVKARCHDLPCRLIIDFKYTIKTPECHAKGAGDGLKRVAFGKNIFALVTLSLA